MAYCQNCGNQLSDGAKFCDSCGAAVGSSGNDGTKRTQKFIGEGLQYKCPNCGNIVSRLSTECPQCGYKIDFSENSEVVKQLVRQIEATGKETNNKYNKFAEKDVSTVISAYDFSLKIQDMLELAIFSKDKIENPFSEDENLIESKAWLGLLKRINDKSKLMSGNTDTINTISEIKKESEEIFNKKAKVKNRNGNLSKLKLAIPFLMVIGGILVLLALDGGNNLKKIDTKIEKAINAKDYEKAEYLLYEIDKQKRPSIQMGAKDYNEQLRNKKNYWIQKINEASGKNIPLEEATIEKKKSITESLTGFISEVGISINSLRQSLGSISNVEVEETDKGIKLSIQSLNFKPDSAELIDEDLNRVYEIAGVLKTIKDFDFLVEGHTAKTDYDDSNDIELSTERAEAVISKLVETGISRKRFIAKGLGSSMPIADNSTAEGRAKNRRVEITILNK